jgi:hypothetical protein
MQIGLKWLIGPGIPQLTDFSATRSAEEHKALHLHLICHFLFGTHDPWAHPEFKAFAAGFNLRLKGQRTLLSVRSLPMSLQIAKSVRAQHFSRIEHNQAFLAAVYNRRVQSVDQVIHLIDFEAPHPRDVISELLYEQFQLRFLRWIRGKGHPKSSIAAVSWCGVQRRERFSAGDVWRTAEIDHMTIAPFV